ncbi:hypothetical protein JXA32_01020 [Candidatus Sumerlaeota bacterium]|nr:hypothetical protein [Candidatus Sumerlaeota bacterium]
MRNHLIMLIIAAFGIAANLDAKISGPYTPDADTLHLYHFDGSGADSATTNAIDLQLYYGATATTDSYSATMGAALNTYEGSGDTSSNQPAALTDQMYTFDNFSGDDGAFTFEAIICPSVELSSIPNNMQIISGDDSGLYRAWHFRVNTSYELEFINLPPTITYYSEPIPTTGEHAWAAGKWFHVAVTYNGSAGMAGNLKFYWTALDSGSDEAEELASFEMTNDVAYGMWSTFGVGNEGRDYSGENFEGLIDEVRISSVAREPDEFLIIPGPPNPVILTQPSGLAVFETQTAVFQTIFESESAPTADWYQIASPTDVYLDPADSRVTVLLRQGSTSDEYISILILDDVAISDAGPYYCRLNNDSNEPLDTDPAELSILAPSSYWPLDQDHYTSGAHQDLIGGRHTSTSGTMPLFVEGYDGQTSGAASAIDPGGWAFTELLDPATSGDFTVSLRASWNESGASGHDLILTQEPLGADVTAADGLTTDSQWQHICLVFESGIAKIYLDGQLASQGAVNMPDDTTALFTFGGNQDGDERFNGALDEIQLFNRALSAGEVYALYSGAEENNPPVFLNDPITKPNATEDAPYTSQTLAGSAIDPGSTGTLTYSKVSGPDWLDVASDGALSGTPDNDDVGDNIFIVRVTDSEGALDEATLNITVENTNDAPYWLVDTINLAGCVQGTSFFANLVYYYADPDVGDSLTFSKISGPDWLNVGYGNIFGMPGANDVGLNTWTIRVEDSAQASADVVININVIARGLVLHYEFNGNANDSSGSNNHGTEVGSPAYDAGRIGQAIQLDGFNDYVIMPPGVANLDAITVAAWVFWNGGGAWQRIFDFGNDTSNYMYLTPRSGDGVLRFSTRYHGYSQSLNASAMLPAGEWKHVALTLNGYRGTVYVDGQVVISGMIDYVPSYYNPTNNLIGDSQWTSDPYFSGRIDDFRIYNYVLSADEVSALVNPGDEEASMWILY